jgi:uncharacterized pyridoxamine 5'-phosphate oxidase family protein
LHETRDDFRALTELISRSNDTAGQFLRDSFQIPVKSLSAAQLVHHLQGVVTVALCTVTSKGRPRVAPVVALLYRGKFHIPTVRNALRTRHVLNNPEVSLTVYEGVDFAVIVHGRAHILGRDDESFETLVALQETYSGSSVVDWGDPVFLRVEPTHLYSFARYPERFPVMDA